MRYTTYYILFVFISIASFSLDAQVDFRKSEHTAVKMRTVVPKELLPDFEPAIIHLEAPVPDGESYRSFLMQQKIQLGLQEKTGVEKKTFVPKTESGPFIGKNFEPKRTLSNGEQFPVYGGIPSDNTLAISNVGTLLLAMNSNVVAYDLKGDSTLFPFDQLSLRQMAGGSINSSYYDPKLFYDPSVDRFILAMLKDNDPENSQVILCFSTSNNPNDAWNVYELSGNPLDNNRWTDFPTIAVTEDKFYFTANFIIPDVSWQVGFDGSMIWEMDKHAAFDGEENVTTVLYDRIKYEGKYIRNIHAVQGADGVSEKMYFLSNRNFDLSNDTVFIADFESDENLRVRSVRADLSYGVPPNARQQDTDSTDPTGGLQTNDARVLGAVSFGDQIQYVANTNNPSTGFSSIYHGIVENMEEEPIISGKIIADDVKDFAYPNIAWSGNQDCDRETIIGFIHSSPTDFPGVSAVYFNNDGLYSPVLTVKEGYNYVDRLPTHYERWGDYFGLQRKYSEPGYVAAFGYLAMENNSNSGYFTELFSPDSTQLSVQLNFHQKEGICSSTIRAIPTGGTAPFEFSWNNAPFSSDNTFKNVCPGDTVMLTITDFSNCTEQKSFIVPFSNTSPGINVFPNPTNNYSTAQFVAPQSGRVQAYLYSSEGRLIRKIADLQAKKGENQFVFSLSPLASGIYQLQLRQDDAVLGDFKVMKE